MIDLGGIEAKRKAAVTEASNVDINPSADGFKNWPYTTEQNRMN